jgi:hypothetical protein
MLNSARRMFLVFILKWGLCVFNYGILVKAGGQSAGVPPQFLFGVFPI